MKDKKYINQYAKDRYPVGTEIWDYATNPGINGPYIINKRSVFEIYDFEYSNEMRPDDPEEREIEILVRNPGKNSVLYYVNKYLTRVDIKHFYGQLKFNEEEFDRKEREKIELVEKNKKITNKGQESYSYLQIYSGTEDGRFTHQIRLINRSNDKFPHGIALADTFIDKQKALDHLNDVWELIKPMLA